MLEKYCENIHSYITIFEMLYFSISLYALFQLFVDKLNNIQLQIYCYFLIGK